MKVRAVGDDAYTDEMRIQRGKTYTVQRLCGDHYVISEHYWKISLFEPIEEVKFECDHAHLNEDGSRITYDLPSPTVAWEAVESLCKGN